MLSGKFVVSGPLFGYRGSIESDLFGLCHLAFLYWVIAVYR
jgi:hypothetical protein